MFQSFNTFNNYFFLLYFLVCKMTFVATKLKNTTKYYRAIHTNKKNIKTTILTHENIKTSIIHTLKYILQSFNTHLTFTKIQHFNKKIDCYIYGMY